VLTLGGSPVPFFQPDVRDGIPILIRSEYIYESLSLSILYGISAQRYINYPDRQLAFASDIEIIPH
jgi:hypothetical protein